MKGLKIVGVILIVVLLAGAGVYLTILSPSAQEGQLKAMLEAEGEEVTSFEVKGDKAYMKGVIGPWTIQQVKDLIDQNPEVMTIVMVNVPGSLDDVSNLEASRLVRKAGLGTAIEKDGHIASGGTDFFCAGVRRTVEAGARIGVHSWGTGDEAFATANDLVKDDPEHQKYLDYYREMGIPKDFYWFTLKMAPAAGMHYMTAEEIAQFGLATD